MGAQDNVRPVLGHLFGSDFIHVDRLPRDPEAAAQAVKAWIWAPPPPTAAAAFAASKLKQASPQQTTLGK